MVIRKAYAKINLGLDVKRRLPNGYHEVKMIMQTVDLFDVLTFSEREDTQIVIHSDSGEIPCNEDNLIYKAAMKLRERTGIERGISVEIQKRIPVAAGMAGGSSDAAATLLGLNELLGCGLTQEELERIGVTIGADVPYCIKGGTALSEGIGEVLTSLPTPPDAVLLIAKPDISVSTKFVYENLHADQLVSHPDIDGMVEAIRNQNLKGICERMENVLETVTIREYPVISRIKDGMKQGGAVNALMSGSGPTVFGIFHTVEDAEHVKKELEKENLAKQIFVTRFFNE